MPVWGINWRCPSHLCKFQWTQSTEIIMESIETDVLQKHTGIYSHRRSSFSYKFL